MVPNLLCLVFNSLDSVENSDDTIQNLETSGYLAGKINVARGVDQIYLMVFPVEADSSRSDGYTSLSLLV